MRKIRDFLYGTLGFTIFGGITLFRLIVIFIGAFPIFLLPIPWWAEFIILLIIVYSVFLGDLLHVIVFIWAFPYAFDYPMPITVIYFVSLVLSAYRWIVGLLLILSDRRR